MKCQARLWSILTGILLFLGSAPILLQAKDVHLDCAGSSWFTPNSHSLEGFEPSDVAWNAKLQLVFIVSDDGRIASFYPGNGTVARVWVVPGNPDLEALTFNPQDNEDFVYLGQEYPALMIKFALKNSTIYQTWSLQSSMDTVSSLKKKSGKHQPMGIESLVYIPFPLDIFVAGRQSDGILFCFRVSHSGDLDWIGRISISDLPDADLSAITLVYDDIWLVHDKPKQLFTVPVKALSAHILSSPKSKSGGIASFQSSKLIFEMRGVEGIALVQSEGSGDKDDFIVLAIDPPKKSSRKDIIVFPLRSFVACFSSGNMLDLSIDFESDL